jgi:hypothetical protein
MSLIIYELIFYLSVITLVVALMLILSDIYCQPKQFVWLAIVCAFSISCDVVGKSLVFMGMNPNISGAIYWLFATIPLSFFFYYSIAWTSLKSLMIFLNVLYFGFAVINLLYIQTLSLNSYSNTLHSLIILFYCITFYYKLLKELPAQQLQRLSLFWIVSGFFFSYAGKMVIYAVTHFLVHFERDNMIVVWSFHNFLSIVGNVIIAYGVWLNSRELNGSMTRV